MFTLQRDQQQRTGELHATLQMLLSKSVVAPQREQPTTDTSATADELHSTLEMLLGAPDSQQRGRADGHSRPRASLRSRVQSRGGDMTGDGTVSSGSGSDQGSNDTSHGGEQVPRAAERARASQSRIPTYYVRKGEKMDLELQVQQLQMQLANLKSENQILATNPQLRPLNKDRLLLRKKAENETMLGAVERHQLSFARVQSAFGKHASTQRQFPFQSHIRLGKDWNERDALLLAMKDKKLEIAQRYTAERTRYLDPCMSFAETSRFTSAEGDLGAIRFDVVPFEGITDVKQVFDALLFYFFNMEISVSEMLGDITIREDDGVRHQGIYHCRMISHLRGDVQVESNAIMFCKLFEASETANSKQCGIFVANYIDEDALYPYSPETRLRNDVTSTVRVSLESRKKVINDLGDEEDEFVVVVTRSCLQCLRHTDLPIPAYEMEDFRRSFEGWGETMLKTEVFPHSSEPIGSRFADELRTALRMLLREPVAQQGGHDSGYGNEGRGSQSVGSAVQTHGGNQKDNESVTASTTTSESDQDASEKRGMCWRNVLDR